MYKVNFGAVFLLLGYFLISISACGKKAVEHPPETSEPFQITITQGGGFTGGLEGYTISSEGKVEKFMQMPGKEKTVMLSTMAEVKQVKEYGKWFESSGLMQESLNEKGNMTTTVRYETADTTYVWSFPTGTQPVSPQAKKLENWCTEVINSFKVEK